VPCPRVRQLERLGIQQSVAACGKLIARQPLCSHPHVQLLHYLRWREYLVLIIDGLAHDQSLLEKHRQQSCRHAMADDIGQIEADVLLIDAGNVIDVTGYPFSGTECSRPLQVVVIGEL